MNPLTRALKLADDPRSEPATRDGANATVSAPGDDFVAPEPSASARTALAGTAAGAPSASAGASPGEAGATRAGTRAELDFRSLRRGRGIGRFVGVALALLAVAGAAAVAATFLWKTGLARPALVRHLPPLPVAVMDLARVRAANAAVGGTAAPGAAPRTDAPPAGSTAAPKAEGRPIVSTADSAARTPVSPSTGLPAPGAAADLRGIATAGRAAPAPEGDDLEPAPGSRARVTIRKRIRADHVAESLERAYEAYLAGDSGAAGQAYRTVLDHEPRNRDARLGLAALAARAGRWEEAAGHYATLLAFHPADTVARAALIGIAEKDPARAESRLKALLKDEPEAAHLHFSLGNLHAARSRWSEARQSWSSAFRLDRGNADHAYNLAVGLDHLSQPRSALELYREALVLARSGPASFEVDAVRRRIRELDGRPDAERAAGRPSPDAGAVPAAHVR